MKVLLFDGTIYENVYSISSINSNTYNRIYDKLSSQLFIKLYLDKENFKVVRLIDISDIEN